ncbi:MAG: ATP-binding protein [Methylobacter sp.]|nr:ATP-binding protein [Methylobacter sp.]
MTPQHETNRVDARPTKEFFISMLTRDIATDRAILDLIDNSIDAYQSNSKTDSRISITINRNEFAIRDNAGGLDLETAKEYAFRFGRSASNPLTPNSVGQFGVGMKRTLFKIAESFYVESRKNDTSYRIDVDIQEWVSKESWDFFFDLLDKDVLNEGETNISVTKLRPETSELFSEQTFSIGLGNEIAAAYFKQLSDGLNIELNGKQIRSEDVFVKVSDELSCLKKSIKIDDVDISIICGVDDRELEGGGWYVICNGRLVSEADQSIATGWGCNGIPKYHPDFAFFRGLVEFSCPDSSKLPWTTTKTGVDQDNKIYKAALHHMSTSMKPVTTFLRERAQEVTHIKEGKISDTPLMRAIENAATFRIYDAPAKNEFIRPERILPTSEENDKLASVQYAVSVEQINLVKKSLEVTTNREVGEKTFQYYFKYECGNE